MAATRRARIVALTDRLLHDGVENGPALIVSGRVLVDGRVITNPSARVRADSAVRVVRERRLKGDRKLSHALDQLKVPVKGRTALDLGASAGGFTVALLDRGARRVYAIDAGVGQLLGRLRVDPRVVNLEGHNLGNLDHRLVPDEIGLVTMDLSYLALSDAIPQLDRVSFDDVAHLLALVKPTFELRRGTVATSDADVAQAVFRCERAMASAGWRVLAHCAAPSTGRHGAREVFVLGVRVVC
jgi:23S rRNA (cytidine1920-2'-O)/16S rRNA (cytidine1409-2'-O)-methyltransferase